ncbi:MAG: ATP-binding cassette domain-containing protein, partial [Nitriliruptoraceae bacterium]
MSANPDHPAIEVRKLHKSFGDLEVLKGIDFHVDNGEVVCVIGPSGSGKSTLLRGIAGLVPVTAGEVYARSLPVLLGVAAALEPDISGRRNVFLGGTALGIRRDHLEEQMDEIIEFAG